MPRSTCRRPRPSDPHPLRGIANDDTDGARSCGRSYLPRRPRPSGAPPTIVAASLLSPSTHAAPQSCSSRVLVGEELSCDREAHALPEGRNTYKSASWADPSLSIARGGFPLSVGTAASSKRYNTQRISYNIGRLLTKRYIQLSFTSVACLSDPHIVSRWGCP